MEAIRSFFLRAKHWQMFLLMFGAYFIGELAIESFIPEGPVINSLKVGLLSEAVMVPFIVFPSIVREDFVKWRTANPTVKPRNDWAAAGLGLLGALIYITIGAVIALFRA